MSRMYRYFRPAAISSGCRKLGRTGCRSFAIALVTRWPKSLELMEEQFAGVPADEKQAMVAGNAVKFFHLDAA